MFYYYNYCMGYNYISNSHCYQWPVYICYYPICECGKWITKNDIIARIISDDGNIIDLPYDNNPSSATSLSLNSKTPGQYIVDLNGIVCVSTHCYII